MNRERVSPIICWHHRIRQIATRLRHTLGPWIFGDNLGFTFFCGALFVFMLRWQLTPFINDNITLVNTLVAVADGHLHIDKVVAGPASDQTPGTYLIGDRLYGRNYGHVVLSLPVLWLLKGLALIADPRIALSVAWSLLWIIVWHRVGRLVDHRGAFDVFGAIGGLILVGANLAVATPLSSDHFPLMALQLTTMGMAALCGVVLYRLVTHFSTQQLGLAAGLGLVLASPVGFWAAIPKRHVPMALLVLCTVYCFYRSRSVPRLQTASRFRALAYAFVGLATWLSAPEALMLLFALVPVDLLTARSNNLRQLALIGSVFFVSLLPFFITNTLIAGTPFEPPQYLYMIGGHPAPPPGGGEPIGGSPTGGQSSASAGPSTGSQLSWVEGLIHTGTGVVIAGLEKSDIVTGRLGRGAQILVQNPEQGWHVLVRSGRIPGVRYSMDAQQTIELALLESLPLAGVLLGTLVGTLRRPQLLRFSPRTWTPARQTDALAMSYGTLLLLLYLPLLPLHATVTVRYLLPAMPLLIYAGCRCLCVRAVVEQHSCLLGWSYTVGVLLGGQFALLGLVLIDPTLGEAVQLHALIHLGLVGALVLWAGSATWYSGRAIRLGTVLLGVTAAATTVFLLLAGWEYFVANDQLALPLVRVLAEEIPLF